MNSNEISMLQMWESLSQVNQYGLFKRLLPVSQFFRGFLTFQYPEKYCGIAFVIENKQPLDLKAFDNFSDIRVELIKDGCSSFLSIQLLSSTNKDVFSSLCLDLVRTIAYVDNEDRRVKLILNQLMKWNALFSKKRCEGLSLSEQQGLFGELCLLKKALLGKRECRGTILESWVGVERALESQAVAGGAGRDRLPRQAAHLRRRGDAEGAPPGVRREGRRVRGDSQGERAVCDGVALL